MIVAVDAPKTCPKCHSAKIEQDPDVLDTWFSSGLWPHSTLGWPDDTEDLRYFYPTTVMETAYDILFFWVARMIMMGIENTGEIPFKYVYLHGLIRDEKGEKMSKTKGNVTDPLESHRANRRGCPAFCRRYRQCGRAMTVKCRPSSWKPARNFANKLWNATRFVIKSIPDEKIDLKIHKESLTVEDRWILSRLSRTEATVNKMMADFQFGEALSAIYDFLWSEYCDWYIELAKVRLNPENKDAVSPLPVLVNVLETALRLLHPFMPFVTEELWQNLKNHLPAKWQKTESIMIAKYPKADKNAIDTEAENIIESVIDITRAIRNIRAENKVESTKWIAADIYSGKMTAAITPYSSAIQITGKGETAGIQRRPVIRSPGRKVCGGGSERSGCHCADGQYD